MFFKVEMNRSKVNEKLKKITEKGSQEVLIYIYIILKIDGFLDY
jgi:hypothetical protein